MVRSLLLYKIDATYPQDTGAAISDGEIICEFVSATVEPQSVHIWKYHCPLPLRIHQNKLQVFVHNNQCDVPVN